jgi:Tol biopolymer transport system component
MHRLILVTILVFAAIAQTPTIDQSLGMQSVGNARISPDGQYVAYTVAQANWEENEFAQQIWIAVVAGGERYQLTSGKKSSQNPKWSADSSRIAFLSERDGNRQIYLIRPHGGEAQQLTSEENGVESMEWAPNGSSIAFSSTGPDAKSK